jgi:hypothetical protein
VKDKCSVCLHEIQLGHGHRPKSHLAAFGQARTTAYSRIGTANARLATGAPFRPWLMKSSPARPTAERLARRGPARPPRLRAATRAPPRGGWRSPGRSSSRCDRSADTAASAGRAGVRMRPDILPNENATSLEPRLVRSTRLLPSFGVRPDSHSLRTPVAPNVTGVRSGQLSWPDLRISLHVQGPDRANAMHILPRLG